MILHIEFQDSTNPYIVYGDMATVEREWKWYEKHEPLAIPCFIGNGLKCRRTPGGWAVGKYFDGAHSTTFYAHLGNALNRLKEEYNRCTK